MIEIRIAGRGGQGAVTAGEIIAISAFESGKWAQSFPSFGVERRGAPVAAFCRIDDKEIVLRSQVYEPDILIVLDSSLLKENFIFEGLKKGGLIVANSTDFKKTGYNCVNIDATSLALDILGKPITNTAMLGAFAAASNLIPLKALTKSLGRAFGSKSSDLPECKDEPGKLKGEILEKNKNLVEKAYELTKKKILGVS